MPNVWEDPEDTSEIPRVLTSRQDPSGAKPKRPSVVRCNFIRPTSSGNRAAEPVCTWCGKRRADIEAAADTVPSQCLVAIGLPPRPRKQRGGKDREERGGQDRAG